MLHRLAASFLSLALLAPIASARDFSQPPSETPPSAGEVAAPVRGPDRAAVRAALAKRRDHNLASFRAYRRAGVYPHNRVRTGSLNVWRDGDGHLCAAATMIDRDGQHDLVQATAEANKY